MPNSLSVDQLPSSLNVFNNGWIALYIYNSQFFFSFLSLNIIFILQDSADPDKMPCPVASNRALHFLLEYLSVHAFPAKKWIKLLLTKVF